MNLRKINPMLRSIGVIGAVAAMVTGVTFAALSNQATLTGNTIASGTATLAVRNSDIPTGFGSSEQGFAFIGIVPGGAGSNIGHFQLQNQGDTNLNLNLLIPSLPTWTVTPSGSVDNTKVSLSISCSSGSSGAFSLTDTVQDIWANTANVTGGPLKAGDTANCTAQVTMTSTAFSGNHAASGAFDLTFTGTAQ